MTSISLKEAKSWTQVRRIQFRYIHTLSSEQIKERLLELDYVSKELKGVAKLNEYFKVIGTNDFIGKNLVVN